MNIPIEIGTHLIALVFGAGGGWFLLKQVRKDVNGLGGIVRDVRKEIESIKLERVKDQKRLAMIVLCMCPADERKDYARMLGE